MRDEKLFTMKRMKFMKKIKKISMSRWSCYSLFKIGVHTDHLCSMTWVRRNDEERRATQRFARF